VGDTGRSSSSSARQSAHPHGAHVRKL
jgi:hypothetical protein